MQSSATPTDGKPAKGRLAVFSWFRWRRLRWLLLLAVLAAPLAAYRPILGGLTRLLICDQQSEKPQFLWIRPGDHIGDADRGFEEVARRCHDDPGLRVVVAEPAADPLETAGVLPTFVALCAHALERRGVPPANLVVIPGHARGPWQATEALGQWLRGEPDSVQVLLLCDQFDSRRARNICDSALDGDLARRVAVAALPDRRYDANNWWQSRDGLKGFVVAWLRRAYQVTSGRGSPPATPWDPDAYEAQLKQSFEKATP